MNTSELVDVPPDRLAQHGQAWFKITERFPKHKQNVIFYCEQMSQQEAVTPEDFIEMNGLPWGGGLETKPRITLC